MLKETIHWILYIDQQSQKIKCDICKYGWDHRPLKTEKHRLRLTLGGDKLEYLGDLSSPAASLIESKLFSNSVVSDSHRGARFISLDIKYYFLQSTLQDSEYMRIHGKCFLDDIRENITFHRLSHQMGMFIAK